MVRTYKMYLLRANAPEERATWAKLIAEHIAARPKNKRTPVRRRTYRY